MPDKITIDIASVKVMRSYDYCHFEVTLSSSSANTPEMVDELRKTAARLADKAVRQYQVAKKNSERIVSEKYNRQLLETRCEHIRTIPELERTVGQQAELKAFDDQRWLASRAYDYEDIWEHDQP